jgi:phospholipid/cholesterol/gamma-HCH transport system substrate-binding protein
MSAAFRLRVQILAFAVIAALGISYVAATYVGVPRLLGLSGYHVTVDLPRAGGLFDNAEVTYRGVPIGRVEDLQAGPDGVRAEAVITTDLDVPRDLEVLVRNRSAIGEQYLDLRPTGADGPFLADGDRLSVVEDDLPMPLDRLMTDVVAFNESVPTGDLRRVVTELYDASQGTGDDLRVLLGASTDLVRRASDGFAATTSLIHHGSAALRTQAAGSEDIRSFSADLRLVADALVASDENINQLISSTPGAAREIGRLVTEVGAPLASLFDDLLTLNGVLAGRRTELADVLGNAPDVIDAYYASLTGDVVRMGLVTNVTAPVPCTTGYDATPRREGHVTSDASLRTEVRCRSPLVRGSAAAPHDDRGVR